MLIIIIVISFVAINSFAVYICIFVGFITLVMINLFAVYISFLLKYIFEFCLIFKYLILLCELLTFIAYWCKYFSSFTTFRQGIIITEVLK
jgi:hypothetical protein